MQPFSFANCWQRSVTALIDAVFPIACLGCKQEGALVCERCFSLIPEPDIQTCPFCLKPIGFGGETCASCRSKTALDGLFVARIYRFRLLKQLIYLAKYRFIQKAAEPLARLILESLDRSALPLPDLLIPVPLHPRRLRYRGFNQSEVIARILSERLTPGLPIPVNTTALQRIRFLKPQMKISDKAERIQNIAGAFAAPPEVAGPLAKASIWLIDDVATTGATLDECARVLKAAGARKVWGIVVAR